MDIQIVKRLRRNLSMHFIVIAFLTAMLVASGSGSLFLPLLIFCVGVAAYVFVDTLEWFEVGRWGSYFLMSLATAAALFQYVYSAFLNPSEQGQLLAVASLLVYPEAVLLLQRKNLRIFEQLAVFLLLEMIVAALVNDNIVFGVLLAPIMLLWVSSLFLFARYATLVHVDPTIETPIPHLAELIFQRIKKSVTTPKPLPGVTSVIVTPKNVQHSRLARRLLQSVPIGIGAIAFAGFFFYLMPRTSPGSLRRPLSGDVTIGLPKQLTMGIVGRLKQDPSPVMRVSLRHFDQGNEYAVSRPPYIRARVMDTYLKPRRDHIRTQGQWVFSGANEFRSPPNSDVVRPLKSKGYDLVRVEFDVRRKYLPTLFAMHGAFRTEASPRVRVGLDRYNAVLNDLVSDEAPPGKSIVYDLGVASFSDGEQLGIAPVLPGPSRREQIAAYENQNRLLDPFSEFTEVRKYAVGVLRAAGVELEQRYLATRTLERDLGVSGKFAYSLDLTLPDNPMLDPIEDFIANKKVGHCQYYASAMVIMMRQLGIPARIVVGYQPREYNKPGRYFAVRQSDAHAWVEGMFSRDDLIGTDLERWLTDADLYWVRFDATPASDEFAGEIVEQRGQTLDYAEKLWKDYVVDGQKLTTENGLYNPVAENGKSAIEELVKNVSLLRNGLTTQGITTTSAALFLIPIVIAIVMLGLIILVIWRLPSVLPRFAPRLARRLGVGQKSHFDQVFFGKCISMLEACGMVRAPSATPREFIGQAADRLASDGVDLNESLDLLNSQYYHQRFGGHQPTSEDEEKINQALDAVSRGLPKNKK